MKMMKMKMTKITWVTRSFLDYRIPVYAALNRLCDNHLTLIYYKDVVPEKVRNKIKAILGNRAIELTGEYRIGGKKKDNAGMANKTLRIPIQPGLIKAIIESQPDVMISDGFFQWTYAPLYIRATKKIPHVMCYERTMHTERNAGLIRTTYRKLALHWIDTIDCSGSLCGKYIRSLGFDKNKITFGHMTADTTELMHKIASITAQETQALRKKLTNNQLIYLYVGQIIPRKGIIEMLSAWKEAGLKDASLILIGNGSQQQEISRFIHEKQIPNVTLEGRIDYEKISMFYQAADCFIIPTLEDNWSLVVPEAMSCGLPVLCSEYNGCWPELVQEKNGWIFNPLKKSSIIDALMNSYKNKAKFKEMGQQSIEIISHHTPEIAANGIWEACQMSIKKTD